jgi:hypothetical protein
MDDEFTVLNVCLPFTYESLRDAIEDVVILMENCQLLRCESHFARGMSLPFTEGQRCLQYRQRTTFL